MEPSYDACDRSESDESGEGDYEATYYKPTQPISQLVNRPRQPDDSGESSGVDEDYECTHD